MKNFFHFLTEAKESQASIQARRMGLKGDGHGGWYNTQGEFVAKTVGGELKFYNKGQKVGQRDTPGKIPQASQQGSPVKAKVAAAPVVPKKEPQKEIETAEVENPQSVTVVFGRFNPPLKDHEKLFNSASNLSSGGEFRIYPSRTQDAKKNPLDPDTKIKYMKKMFPKFEENIVNNENMVNLFDVLQGLEEDGFTDVTIVVGSDRLGEFKNLSNKYNGELYNFENINIVSIGKDADGEAQEGRIRQAISSDDFGTFRSSVPKSLNDKEAKSLFATLKKSMGGLSKQYEEWEISPKTDWKGLRENYISNRIFNVGEIVENLNTGLVGKIIRRGTNYLICVTEEDIMFKSWIYDIKESEIEVPSSNLKKLVKKSLKRTDNNIDGFVDKNDPKTGPYGAFIPQMRNVPSGFKMKEWTEISGVPADQREVGTDALRKYTMKMSNTTNIKNFINKYKKKIN